MKAKKSILFTIELLSCVLCIFLFATCEVGLGSSVDIERPSVSIDYPPANSTIKNSFIISGKTSDETNVKSISITLKGTNNNRSYGPYSATVNNAAGNWYAEINKIVSKNSFEIQDGNYLVTVTATDGAGRTQTSERGCRSEERRVGKECVSTWSARVRSAAW